MSGLFRISPLFEFVLLIVKKIQNLSLNIKNTTYKYLVYNPRNIISEKSFKLSKIKIWFYR